VSIARSIASVVIGYLIFALAAFARFQISGQPPHQSASVLFMFGITIYGAVFALLGGYVAAMLGKRRPMFHGFAVGAVLALGALVSLLSTLGKGAIWSQIAALAIMAPSPLLVVGCALDRYEHRAGPNVINTGNWLSSHPHL
jgi:hypothetical protein